MSVGHCETVGNKRDEIKAINHVFIASFLPATTMMIELVRPRGDAQV